MTADLVPLVVGNGVWAAHAGGVHGTVVGAFRHGFYVQVHREVYAVAGPDVVAGPIHLVLRAPPPRPPDGLAVWRSRGLLCSSDWQVDLDAAPTFQPLRPTSADLQARAPVLAAMLRMLVEPEDLAAVWPGVLTALAEEDLSAARQLLQGRGGGLTPTGDDVLAGILLVHAWRGHDARTLPEVAKAAETTNLSRSFLAWAARGESLAPVHHLLALAGYSDADEMTPDFRQAVHTVTSIGNSSGNALLWGIGLGVSAATGTAVSRAPYSDVRSARS